MTTKITEKNISNIANAGVQWQSVIVADGSTTTTGVAGRGYFINTTSAAHTFTLPATATFADTILIKDYAGTFATNKLTIARNGHNIQGVANNSLIGTNRASVVLVYVDTTRGWEFTIESNVADLQFNSFITATGGTVTTSGNFKIHNFTGDGCFVVATIGAGPAGGPSNVDYLVVAGGAGGGSGYRSGGGGAGGYRTTFPSPSCNAGSFPVSATTYPITVGAGGAGGTTPENSGTNGSNSVFSTITSAGGGFGGGKYFTGPHTGGSGGSGGGGTGGGTPVPAAGAGGTGNSPPVSPPQGNPGGAGQDYPVINHQVGGGGGGASAAGSGSGPSRPGGAGSANSITASSVTYAGGGGGGGYSSGGPGTGGSGGGGAGGGSLPAPGTAGTANTGGGGGGAAGEPGCSTGGAGGKGIVIIRYKFQ